MIAFQENASLEHLNTFRIPARAKGLTYVESLEGLDELVRHPRFSEGPRLILGGGSNILFTRDFDGLVVKVNLAGISAVESDNHVLVTVCAGENWHAFVQYCIDRNWGGIENLSLIPGTVGAAPIQNIGAYGVEIQQVIEYVDGVDLTTGEHRRLNPQECQFGYRESVFKQQLREKFFVSSITLRMTRKLHHLNTGYGAIREVLERKKIAQPTLRDVSEAVIAIRRSKLPDPAVIGNAGSFFKNPMVPADIAAAIRKDHPSMPSYSIDSQYVKIPAGWLIEQCGWKGKKMGRVGVHEQQALVLVNFGGGNGEEILALATKIQDSVREKFGVSLMTEVNIV